VLELGTLIAGPFAGRLLGDMGADVIKVEPPGAPDPLRTWGQAEVDGHHVFWTVHARNKRAITLDLRRPRGRELFLDLIEKSDIVVENFRPGTLEKWDLGYDVLSQRNSGIILVRVSGYGQTGPDAHKAGYASVAEAASGLRHLNGFPGGPPPRLALSLGDSLGRDVRRTGSAGRSVPAQRHRARPSGRRGTQRVMLAVQESTIPDYDVGGVVRGPSGTRLEGIAPSNIYRSADGSWVVIAANQDTVFARLCRAMGRAELATDERFATHVARGRNQDELDKIIGDWAAEREPNDIIETLSAAGVISGPINTVADVVNDPQLRARGMLVEHHDERLGRPVLGPGITPLLSESPGSVRNAGSARPGQHNDDVYIGLLGKSVDELEKLRAEDVFKPRFDPARTREVAQLRSLFRCWSPAGCGRHDFGGGVPSKGSASAPACHTQPHGQSRKSGDRKPDRLHLQVRHGKRCSLRPGVPRHAARRRHRRPADLGPTTIFRRCRPPSGKRDRRSSTRGHCSFPCIPTSAMCHCRWDCIPPPTRSDCRLPDRTPASAPTKLAASSSSLRPKISSPYSRRGGTARRWRSRTGRSRGNGRRSKRSWRSRTRKRIQVLYLDLDNPGVFNEPQQVKVSIGRETLDDFQVTPKKQVLRRIPIKAAQLGTGELAEIQIAVDRHLSRRR